MTDRHHLLVYGGTFAAVGDRGDISGVRGAGAPDGLFVRDARHLSRWQLTVDGAVPEVLAPVADGDAARCVLVPRGGRTEPPRARSSANRRSETARSWSRCGWSATVRCH